MTKSIFEFTQIESLKQSNARKYTIGSNNYLKAWALFISTENLKEIVRIISNQGGNHLGDAEKFQLNIIWRGSHALESCYLLVKHYQYSAAYGRNRYLFEVYWLVKYLNNNKTEAKQLWNNYREKVKENPYGDYIESTEYAADLLSTPKGNEKNQLFKKEDEYKNLYNYLSNRGSHPHSLVGVATDGSYAKPTEWDILNGSLELAFGIAAQLVRTVEETEIRWPIQELVDSTIVDIKIAHDGPPATFLKGDLKFWSPRLFM